MKIAIIGPPGSGKTTLAAGLFYKLKKINKKVEFVPELIKYRVYKNEDFSKPGFDIANTLEQQAFELAFDSEKFDYLICEAPLCNGYFYSSFYKKEDESVILKKIAEQNINNYDIILVHGHITGLDYVSFGRKETKEESVKLGDFIKQKFLELNFKGITLSTNQNSKIYEIIDKINKIKMI